MGYYADHTSYSFWTQVSENCGGGFIVLPITADAFREFINDVSVPGAVDAFDQMYFHGGGAGVLPAVRTQIGRPDIGRCLASAGWAVAVFAVDALAVYGSGGILLDWIGLADATAVGSAEIVNVAAAKAADKLSGKVLEEAASTVQLAPISVGGDYYFTGERPTAGSVLRSLLPSVSGTVNRFKQVGRDCGPVVNQLTQ